MGVSEVRLGETKTSADGRAKRISFFQARCTACGSGPNKEILSENKKYHQNYLKFHVDFGNFQKIRYFSCHSHQDLSILYHFAKFRQKFIESWTKKDHFRALLFDQKIFLFKPLNPEKNSAKALNNSKNLKSILIIL